MNTELASGLVRGLLETTIAGEEGSSRAGLRRWVEGAGQRVEVDGVTAKVLSSRVTPSLNPKVVADDPSTWLGRG